MSGRVLLALVLGATLLAAGCAGGESAREATGDNPSADLIAGEVRFDTTGWRTDFSRRAVPLDEFISGGPPRDGIPPIDDPTFVPIGVEPIEDAEPVISVAAGDSARAYPIRIMIWHEIVNDRIGDRPIAVTFCPLCRTSVVFDRVLDGRELTFGTTGNLRKSDLVMWDRQTESWWQQFSGEAIVGELTGARLRIVPSQLISHGEFRRRFPEGRVLSSDTGHERRYGQNPYVGYDDLDSRPFLLDEEVDGRLAPKQRVVTVEGPREFAVYPLDRLARAGVIDDQVDGRPVVVWHQPGLASALDTGRLADGERVGTALVYGRRVRGRTLTFSAAGPDTLRDLETGSTWDRDGRATGGPLAGARLPEIAHDIPFWFAVAAFRPDARIHPG